MDKREMIERALGRFLKAYGKEREASLFGMLIRKGGFFDALAEQTIVIECEVEHSTEPIELGDFTTIGFPDGIFRRAVNLGGHLGTPGKAIAIILPLDNKP